MGTISVYVLVLCATLAQCREESETSKLKDFQNCCVSSGITAETVVKIQNGEFPDDDRVKPFFFCLSKVLGFMHENGDYNVDAIRKKIRDTHINDEVIMIECTRFTGTSEEKAFKFAKCMAKFDPPNNYRGM